MNVSVGAYCCAPGCGSNKRAHPKLQFHKFPTDPDSFEKWKENLGRPELMSKDPASMNKHYFLCSKHFDDDQYTDPEERKLLISTGVPTIFSSLQKFSVDHSATNERKRKYPNSNDNSKATKRQHILSSGNTSGVFLVASPSNSSSLVTNIAQPTTTCVKPVSSNDVDEAVCATSMKLECEVVRDKLLMISPVINSEESDEPLIDVEKLDEVTRKTFYTDCSPGQKKLFRVVFDSSGLDPRDLAVTITDRILEAKAVKRGIDEDCEISQKIRLPSDVLFDKIQCKLDDNRMIIEADVNEKPLVQESSARKYVKDATLLNCLNKPRIINGPYGKTVEIIIDIGRMFHENDIIVKIEDSDRIRVCAERTETDGDNHLSAKVVRVFNLPVSILPESLEAGLAPEGLLKVQATACK